MRLICPNCGAQYEVPDEVIPVAGRDVQCSSCGHTWFQTREGPEESAPPTPEPQPAIPPTASDEPSAAAEPAPAQPAESPRPEAAGGPREETPSAAEDPEATPPRRRLDPEVAALLREEAERESRARAAESQPLESQPDLGLEDGGSRPAPDAKVGADGPARSGERSRGSLLPDIDEINRGLRPAEAEADPVPEAEPSPDTPARGSGFSRGFALALLLGVVIVALYSQADRIAAAVPALAPLLEAYVSALDALRLWAYDSITALLVWIEGLGE